MRDRVYRTEGLIIRRSDLGEADRLLTLATPAGRRRVIAKGVRKTTSRLAAQVELFTQANLMLAIGRNLDIVTQSQTKAAFSQLHRDLDLLNCAYYLVELYEKFTEEEEENRPLYQLLCEAFGALDSGLLPDLVLRSAELHLLTIVGYQPNLYRCSQCARDLDEAARVFSSFSGGMLCPACEGHDSHGLHLSLAAFKLLRYLQTRPFAAIGQLQISEAVRAEAEAALRGYLRRLLERDLRTLRLLAPHTK